MSYTVKAGDTLFSIAHSHGTTLEKLQAANPGVVAKNLQVGQVLHLPSSGAQPSKGNGYVQYSGPASNFPNSSEWASYDNLWKENERLMKFHDSASEIALIKKSIETVAKESGVDHRVILCIIVQESGGNPRVKTTNNGVRNPGLMQSHNGAEFNPKDPAGSILQMIRDGTEGTKDGDGLKQLKQKYGNWYEAFRGYNSGSVNKRDLNDPVGATASYVRDAANRLMGHVWNGM
ncbi:hypothetical protein Daus18300_004813 [Diaporthe australafricana]|uniref:LysM domain-containing protein n=1 Tax=Diaporthe australafricana TaxID=127596 RepID=A0ABR3X574_9PEZI